VSIDTFPVDYFYIDHDDYYSYEAGDGAISYTFPLIATGCESKIQDYTYQFTLPSAIQYYVTTDATAVASYSITVAVTITFTTGS
jgi:hypothetical protein